MNNPEDTTNIPAYLVETVENLLSCLSLSRQNEMSFPPSLFAHERAFIRRRAKSLGYHTVTKKESIALCESFVCVYKNKPEEKLSCKYPVFIVYDILKKTYATMEKYPITPCEYRIFASSTDYDDFMIQEGETRTNRDLTELDLSFTPVPTQAIKSTKFNVSMNEYRKSLPIFNYKQVILNHLSDNQVLIIHGGVASGKSTQVPQFLMETCFEAKVGYKIFLCEPFRITTVAVAERIAYERKEEIGQSVGYQIPLETKKSATSVVICLTPDVLLKMLISQEQVFQGKVIVILDEFEERDYVTEFLLIGLKDLFKVNPFLRLIIMTNANDVTSLFTYFSSPKTVADVAIGTATISMSSNLVPIQEYFLEDILMRTDFLNRCRMKTGVDIIVPPHSREKYFGKNAYDRSFTEVIDSTLEKAWHTGDSDVFIFLLNAIKKNVISVNYQLKGNGVTLLMAACFQGKMEYVLELLKSGADATVRSYGGFTAIDWASQKNYAAIIEILQYYLISNNEKTVTDREFIKLTASTNFSEHTNRLITYYENFYPEHGVDLELLFKTVLHIHAFSKPGAIMIFLPSFFDILSFRDVLFERESELVSSGGCFTLRFLHTNMQAPQCPTRRDALGIFPNCGKFLILPQTSEQKLIFQVPPPDCRKIILSTNIGAVGITISDLVYVIDTGKIEQKMYVGPTGELTFMTGWITFAQALQRATKVGRLQPGCCYRLYSRLMTLPEKNPVASLYSCSPKILCLYTKQMVPDDMSVSCYLQRALTVPEDSLLKQSVDILKSIDAFDICRNYEHLTELGKIMLQLPLEPQYAKMVLYAVALKCLDPILTIAAFSKHKSIFKLEEKFKIKSHIAAKEWKKISSKHYSDHLILIKLFLGRQNAGIEKCDQDYCEDFCISQSTIELVNTTRSNIVGHLRAMGIVKTKGVNDMRDLNSNSKEWVFVKAAIVGGLYPNLIFVDRSDNKLKCNNSGEEILFHPLSTLYDFSALQSSQTVMLTQEDVVKNLPTDWLVYDNIGCSYSNEGGPASMCTAVTPVTLALFAGSYKICAALRNQKIVLLLKNDNSECEESDSGDDENTKNTYTFMIDSNLKLELDYDSAKTLIYLRIKWFSYFLRCLRSPSKAITAEEKQILETLASVMKSEEKCKFLAEDPEFIGHKPVSYTIDLFQQPLHDKAMTDVVNPIPLCAGLITENSRYFLIKSYKDNNMTASILNSCWKFEPATEAKLTFFFKSGIDVKLIFQLTGTNCFQGLAVLMSDEYVNTKNINGCNFLPIQWLKEGLVPVSVLEEYMDAVTCLQLTTAMDGTEIDCSLASILMMVWTTSRMILRNGAQMA